MLIGQHDALLKSRANAPDVRPILERVTLERDEARLVSLLERSDTPSAETSWVTRNRLGNIHLGNSRSGWFLRSSMRLNDTIIRNTKFGAK